MKDRSILYRGGGIFRAGMRLLHGRDLDRRYEHIAREIEEVREENGGLVTILEPGCGPVLLADHLPRGCNYKGFDTNEIFLRYAFNKGHEVWEGDATDDASYRPADVVVLCDFVHHIGPDDEKTVFEKCVKAAKKKIIICDPFKDDYLKLKPQGLWERFYNWIEKDGHNNVRLKNTRMKADLEADMKDGFGVIPADRCEITDPIGEDLIAMYRVD